MYFDLNNIRQQTLMQWMQDYGDAILRTCYLLCGNLEKAHAVAQHVFIQAYEGMRSCPLEPYAVFLYLLQITFDECPCAFFPKAIELPNSVTLRLLALPSRKRSVAILCLYHNLSIAEAAGILRISEQTVSRLLAYAKHAMSR